MWPWGSVSEPGQSPARRSPRREGPGPDSTEAGLRRGERTWGHPLSPVPVPASVSTPAQRWGVRSVPDAGLTTIVFVGRLPDGSAGFGDREGRT